MILHKTISTREEVEKYLRLSENEIRWFEQTEASLPFLVSTYYLSLIDPDDPHDPLRRQVIPSIEESEIQECELLDPLQEVSHSPLNRLIHRYDNRVALLVTDRCATYCRHCFRRRFTATEKSVISDKEVKEVTIYLANHKEVKEMLLTGGDPLLLSDEKLRNLITQIREKRADLTLRLCTRVLATYPMRITKELVETLVAIGSHPMFVMTQFNHPKEITTESVQSLSLFIERGFPIMNQSVLLKGVNDDVDTLEELMNLLVSHRVKPYYLFQGDLVEGSSHLRVPLEKGVEIERELRRRLSGLAMPQYALDLPHGGGKVPLNSTYLESRGEEGWVFKTLDGERRVYPSTC